MKKNNVIPFEPVSHILETARNFLESPEMFLEQDKEQAVNVLMRALKYADSDMRYKIFLLLGFFAKEQIVSHLFEVLHDPKEDDHFRNFVATQLSHIIPSLKEGQQLIDQLFEDLRSPDNDLRMYAATALAWEWNYAAAIPFMELLFDPDTDVQQCAVYALSRLGDDRIYPLFIDRLEHGSTEQKKCILFNLWHFDDKKEQTLEIYLKYLRHPDEELRMDALVLLTTVTDPEDHLEAYRKCLDDPDSRIRALAVKHIEEFSPKTRNEFINKIKQMANDPSSEVRQAVVKLLKLSGRNLDRIQG